MDHGPERHGISHLSVEPDIFIGRKYPRELGTNDTNNVAEHRKEDETTGVGEDKTSATRCPNRVREAIQSGEFIVCLLKKEAVSNTRRKEMMLRQT